MLQHLLSDFTSSCTSKRSRDFPAYALVIAKTGSKLRESDGAAPASIDGFPDMPVGRPALASINTMSGGFGIVRMRGQQALLTSVVRMLRMPDERPVVDKTGLTGKYDFTLEFSKERPAPNAPAMFPRRQRRMSSSPSSSSSDCSWSPENCRSIFPSSRNLWSLIRSNSAGKARLAEPANPLPDAGLRLVFVASCLSELV